MNTTEWRELMLALESSEVSICVEAAAKLHAEASEEDIPRLLALLESEDFFLREAAAWPLAELNGPLHLRQLLVAYQRGFDDGHDNDGFTAALLEIPSLFPTQAPVALSKFIELAEEPLRGHAAWLFEFCPGVAPSTRHGA